MLLKRVLTGAVLVPLLLGFVLYGKGVPFLLFVEVVALLCAGEYYRMYFPATREGWVGIALAGMVYAAGTLLPFPLALSAVFCIVALGVFHFLRVEGTAEERVRGGAIAVLGAVYIGGFFSAYPRVMSLPRGEHWILMCLLAVSIGDTAAYFVGKSIGRRPLAPRISPNKTVEGAVGGLLAAVVAGTAYGAYFLPGVASWYTALSAVLVGVVGQAGDLFESMLKRGAGVKDSGSILPGHGGMFDRADGVLAAGPVLYLLAALSPFVRGLP